MVVFNDDLNPFTHHVELTTTYDKVRTAFFTIVILPIRLIIIVALLVFAWCLACIGLYGLTEEDLCKKPIKGWRRVIREWICIFGQYAYSAGGMHITVKGKQVSRAEAPILVIAPHSTFLDAAIVYVTGFPSIIVRRESGMNPWLGKLINFTQPVHVRRDDPNSRHRTIQDIIDRTTSKEDWPQLLIFPEGTCTNRSCLITFKPGAFIPGVPVQPVLIRYPNKLDTVTWTWYGPGALKLLWLTLTRAYSNCEVELLPVYTPSEDEKKDPKLYAHNVRNLMAKALGIPTCDYSYEDTPWLIKAEALELPQTSQLVITIKLRNKLGLTRRNVEKELIGANLESFRNGKKPKLVTKEEFARLLLVNETESALEELFNMYSQQDAVTMLNLQNYLLAVHLTNEGTNKRNMIRTAFDCYDDHLTKEKFQYVMWLVYFISYQQSELIFTDICQDRSSVSFDEYIKYVQMFPPDVLNENNNAIHRNLQNKKDK